MNMFLHNINYDKFNIALGNTLLDPHFRDDELFDAIVSNPPYSVKWIGTDDPTLINDDRFAPAGVLAPKSKADFAFVLHALSYLSSKGFGTSIAVNILVLSKHKSDNKTQFIDASSLFKKATNNNILTEVHIEQIMQLFDKKEDTEYLAKSVDAETIAENDYNLSVSSYVEAEDTREKIDITVLNAELKTTVAKIDQLRSDIDTIVAEIEVNKA